MPALAFSIAAGVVAGVVLAALLAANGMFTRGAPIPARRT